MNKNANTRKVIIISEYRSHIKSIEDALKVTHPNVEIIFARNQTELLDAISPVLEYTLIYCMNVNPRYNNWVVKSQMAINRGGFRNIAYLYSLKYGEMLYNFHKSLIRPRNNNHSELIKTFERLNMN